MSAPPGEPSPPAASSQPLPQQPLPTTPPLPTAKPTPPPNKKPRQRRHQPDTAGKDKEKESPHLVHHHHYPTQPGPIFQPYHPPYHIMNPPYPINGPPYPQHHHPQYLPQPQPVPQNSSPGQAPHPQYAYPMHPGSYAHHPAYPPYPQYHQPMMMFPPPRQNAPDTPQSAPSPAMTSATGGKRKRKSAPDSGRLADRASDDEAAASGSDASRAHQIAQAQAQALVDLKKRTKTQRACDSCRSRKIRCDILAESDPPVCQHCKQYGFECTFFLPITETRFKKKKLEDDGNQEKEKSVGAPRAASSPNADPQSKRDIGIIGPTAPAHLLHSQATISSRVYENYDLRYHHSFQVSKMGDGLIQVQKPANDEQQLSHTKPVDLHIERDVIETLVNAYFTDIAPMLPIVTKAEFLATPNPPPVLLYSMCLVAAARREVPQNIFDSIRYAVNNVIKAEDVLSTASIVNVQALLILCMTGDCHSQFVPTALSALWIRLGSAIRMAQDLGLHRAESVMHNIEQRRRLWGACLICDRWTSIAYGHPYMIDVQDCDARLPSSGDLNDLYMDELVRLSIILGRVQKTIYSPSGLTFTTDDMLYELLADMQRWKEGLPDHLRYQGPDTPQNAGLLHLLYACVCMMFWRVFMRISYSCPAHLKFGLTVEQWSELVALTAECIDWLEAYERVYDVWLLVAYAATSCALVQYHTCIRRKDDEAENKLRKLKDCVRRWEGAISPDHMSARRKTAEIIALLYEATQGPPMPMEAPALNPTGGVKVKPPVILDYRKDPTRPGSGVFIAHGKPKMGEEFQDLPEGTIISASSEDDAAGSEEGEAPFSTDAVSSPPLDFVGETDVNHAIDYSIHGGFVVSPPPPPSITAATSITSASVLPTRLSSSSPVVAPTFVGDVRTASLGFGDNRGVDAGISIPVSNSLSPLGDSQHHHQQDDGHDGMGNGVQQQQQQSHASMGQNSNSNSNSNSAPLVNITPLTAGGRGNYSNVNPAMNLQASLPSPGNVQVMNVLDGAQGGATLHDFAIADNGFLEGIPGGMFDWGQWETFFSRFNAQGGNVAGSLSAFAQHQQQQQQQQQAQQQQQSVAQAAQPPSPQQNLPRFAS